MLCLWVTALPLVSFSAVFFLCNLLLGVGMLSNQLYFPFFLIIWSVFECIIFGTN